MKDAKQTLASQVAPLKIPLANAGEVGSIPGGENPLEEGMKSTRVFLPGESHGQSRLVGYSPRSHKELDTTE